MPGGLGEGTLDRHLRKGNKVLGILSWMDPAPNLVVRLLYDTGPVFLCWGPDAFSEGESRVPVNTQRPFVFGTFGDISKGGECEWGGERSN